MHKPAPPVDDLPISVEYLASNLNERHTRYLMTALPKVAPRPETPEDAGGWFNEQLKKTL